jgi:PAS domain S-box-containing protein
MSSILVLDDLATERDLLSTVLGYAGHTVVQAATGEEALGLARKSEPELILVDLMMPGMNGYEFVRELRADPRVGNTRVVFCSATYALNEVRRLAESCGVSHILAKPCEPEEIIGVVSKALDSSRGDPRPRMAAEEFDREQLRVLNAKLVQKVSELEAVHEELCQAQRQTAESLTLLETLQSTAPVGFGFVDKDFRMRRMNETLAAVNGLPLEEQLGRTVAEVVPDIWPQLEPIYQHVLATGEAVVNQDQRGEVPSAPGETRHWLSSYYPVRLDDEVIGIGLVVVDITDREQAEDFRAVVMQNMAEGLYVLDDHGRLVFMNAAAARMTGWSEDELRGKAVHAAIHYQHADGSSFAEEDCDLLKVHTERRTVRITDDSFTRRDGSIFPVAYSAAPLLSGTNVRGAVVVFRDTTEESAERTRVQRELNVLTWVGRIREALDEGRLVLYSQPIVPLTARATRSEELLVRMIGRDGEIIAPGVFLPVAEKYGLIGEIDKWVITQAAILAATGRHVCANLSADSIGNLDLLCWIEHKLSETGADPANVVFEITETSLMGNMEAGKAFTRGINEIGCAIALDDFGTGFGSFTYLQKLHVDDIKIDVEFVRDLVSNTANQHLVKATVNIGQGFGVQTIAEGVEDSETLELLRGYGVDLAQGFHLGRPAPLDLPNPDDPHGRPLASYQNGSPRRAAPRRVASMIRVKRARPWPRTLLANPRVDLPSTCGLEVSDELDPCARRSGR